MQTETLTASTRKLITSLKSARHRREERLFVIEGTRAVTDTAGFFDVAFLVATAAWPDEHAAALPPAIGRVAVAKNDDIARMSSLNTPQGVIAVCRMPEAPEMPELLAPDELVLALDKVQDPGNLGTIIRVADWMGVRRILASADTVDVYNPKVVQATMGAIARVEVIYTDLPAALARLGQETPVYGTFLDGANIYDSPLSRGGIVVMGNEGNGISDEVGALVSRRLLIPPYPADSATVESLNVSVATAITLAEFRRRAANQCK